MRILVTGATGFFGPEIVSRLRTAGHQVTPAARHADPISGVLPVDVTRETDCERVFALTGPFDAVVHAAAIAHVCPDTLAMDECLKVNATGTEHMIKAAVNARVRRFVYISSVLVYGDHSFPPGVTEDGACETTEIYGRAKLLAERACIEQRDQIELYVLRMATMYSPDWLVNIRKRVRPFQRGRRLYLSVDPLRRRYTLCSRRNGAEAVLWAVEGRLPADLYNVADQYIYSQEEILGAIEATDGPGLRFSLPVIVPWLVWNAVRIGVPIAAWRDKAQSAYWKFCRYNIYSTERLQRAGFIAPPDLLSVIPGATGAAKRARTASR